MQESFRSVDTDCGLADVFHQGPRGKSYLCPLCETLVEGEWHVVIRPKENHDLRRHAHTQCLEKFIEYGLNIKILPGRKNR